MDALLNGLSKESIASYMAISGNIFAAIAILFGYYLRKNFSIDMWGYSIINSIAITGLIIISCYFINPKLSLELPKGIYPTLILTVIFSVIAIMLKIVALTYTNNIGYTVSYKLLGNIIVFLGSAFILKENFSIRGVIGLLLGLVSVYLIFSEQNK